MYHQDGGAYIEVRGPLYGVSLSFCFNMVSRCWTQAVKPLQAPPPTELSGWTPVQILFQMCFAYIEINFFIAWNQNTNFTNVNNEKNVLHAENILQQALGKSPQSCDSTDEGFLSVENMFVGCCS